jgi:uncharacterized membrane protein YqiK
MDEVEQIALLIGLGLVGLLALGGGVMLLYATAYRKVEQGHALVISKQAQVDVWFTGGLVLPWVHRAEVIDVRSKTVTIDRRGKDGLHCRDNVRADVVAVLHLRVQKTAQDVLKVAQTVGCARAGDPAVLEELFAAKLVEALRTVTKSLEFEQIITNVQSFRDEVIQVIGQDLQGYVLDDIAIERIAQTPIDQLDPNDMLDAEGIRKIVERTTQEKVRRNELELETERTLRRRQAELEELILELERQRTDALANLRKNTGRQLTEADLRERIDDRIRELVRPVVEEVLAEPRGVDEMRQVRAIDRADA